MRRTQIILATTFMALFFVFGVSFLLLSIFSLSELIISIKFILWSIICFIGMVSLAKDNLKVWKHIVGRLFFTVALIFTLILIANISNDKVNPYLKQEKSIINVSIILVTSITGLYFIKSKKPVTSGSEYSSAI